MKNLLQKRGVRLGLLLLALSFLAFHIKTRTSTPFRNVQARYIPPQGVIKNDTKGQVPGDPNNAIEDFKKLYPLILEYREKYGKYPSLPSDIFMDVKRPGDYGVKSVSEVMPLFLNPDARYSDDPFARKHAAQSIKYSLYGQRRDGIAVGSSKASGQKDVLASTSLYYHQNVRTFPGSRSTSNPVGFYIVLWDDGTIQKIPYDQILYVPKGDGDFLHAFPGQAGVPANAKTYDQFYQLIGFKKGPRGKPGGKGVSYKGSSIP